MRVPLHNNLDELFRSDKTLVSKVLGGAFVTAFIVLIGAYKQSPIEISENGYILLGLFSGSVGAILVLGLALKDYVERKLDRYEPVNFLLRLYFTGGPRTAAIWFGTVFIMVFVITMTLVSCGIF